MPSLSGAIRGSVFAPGQWRLAVLLRIHESHGWLGVGAGTAGTEVSARSLGS